MKKLVILLTLALVLAFAAPVFANPFSDVPADHWAYDAINKLADDGVVKGNADGTFTGKKAMTRYEMATLVARAMAVAEANDEKVTAEDKAMIEKLQAEFGAELNALGVRVAALENKVGNVKITGDARVRFLNDKAEKNGNGDSEKYSDIRVRLVADAKVNDKVNVVARLRVNDYRLDSNASNPNVDADNFYIKYANASTTAIVGRTDLTLGKGTIFDDTLKGAIVSTPVGNLTFTGAYGYLDNSKIMNGNKEYNFGADNKVTLTALQLDGIKLGQKATLGLDYGIVKDKDENVLNDDVKVCGVNLDYAFNNKVGLFAEYAKTDMELAGNDDNQDAYIIGLNVKEIAKKTNLKLAYGDYGINSVLGGLTSYDDQVVGAIGQAGKNKVERVKLWDVKIDRALMANTNLYIEYSQAKTDKVKATDDEGKYTRFETGIEFKF